MLRNVIFDYGCVLVDWNPHYLLDPYFSSREECAAFLHDYMPLEFHNDGDMGTPIAEVEAKWSARNPEQEWAYRLYFSEFEKTVSGQIPGMEELVKELKQKGYHVYGLSNWSWETHSKIRGKCPILGLLEGEVISGLVHRLKPNPDIYEYCLETYGLKAEESVFIDDRQPNVDGAVAVGIHGLRFSGEKQLRADLKALAASLA